MSKEKVTTELLGKDYMYKPIAEIIHDPDYSAHAMRVILAISKMTSKQLEELTIVRGSFNGR